MAKSKKMKKFCVVFGVDSKKEWTMVEAKSLVHAKKKFYDMNRNNNRPIIDCFEECGDDF